MTYIQNVTADAIQTQTFILPDGTSFFYQLRFVPMQFGWFLDTLSYGTNFTINGFRITNSPNMLQQWRNLIPFGLACYTAANREPSQQQDFSSGASQLFVLSQAEVIAWNETLQNG